MRDLLILLGVASPSLLIHDRVGLDRIGGHTRAPENLVGQWYMTMVEIAACRVPEDLASPIQAGGYVMACMTFYEWGFGVPSHRLLRSLLQFYSLELHHLTPSGVLHMVAFVTLCEAYMGIEPHFNLCNYFFHAWLQQGSGTEMMTLGNVDIFVQSGHGVDPYFHLPMSNPLVGWRKVWFIFWNDTDVLLPIYTGSRPIP
jgi:hypothetical protein